MIMSLMLKKKSVFKSDPNNERDKKMLWCDFTHFREEKTDMSKIFYKFRKP